MRQLRKCTYKRFSFTQKIRLCQDGNKLALAKKEYLDFIINYKYHKTCHVPRNRLFYYTFVLNLFILILLKISCPTG